MVTMTQVEIRIPFDLRITGYLLYKHRKTIYQLEANTELYLML